MEFLRPLKEGSSLSQIERWKLARHPLEIADAVRTRYANEGYESIGAVPGEVERLKWAGIYPQRQEGDAFMMRVKIPGGRLLSDQARVIGEIVDEFAVGPTDHPIWGNRYCDLTTRQDIQLHWLKIADIPQIWDRFDAVGVTTIQACGDTARNVLGCPVAGVDRDEAFNAGPLVEEISGYFTNRREYANLPRKFKLSVTGCLDDCAQAEINDIGLWPARLDDGTLGFNLLVGGGLSDGPRTASDLDTFVGTDEAIECCRAIAQLFGELGNRENRGFSRMRYLVQELGPETFRKELANRAQFFLRPSGTALTRRYRGDHIGVHRQHDENLSYVGCSVPVGRMTGVELIEAARLSAIYGDGEIRIATDQNFIITGVHDDALSDLLNEDLMKRYSPNPGPFSRGVVACTGSEFCRYAIVETKVQAVNWATEMDRRFAKDFPVDVTTGERKDDAVVRMHFSGCSASCAQPQIADIGFRGDTGHVGDAIVEAVDIGLGGSLGTDAAFGDWLAGAVPVENVADALSVVMGKYIASRRENEPFHQWSRRQDQGELAIDLNSTAQAVTS